MVFIIIIITNSSSQLAASLSLKGEGREEGTDGGSPSYRVTEEGQPHRVHPAGAHPEINQDHERDEEEEE